MMIYCDIRRVASLRLPELLIAITIGWLHITSVRSQLQRRSSWLNVACKPCHCHLNRSLVLRLPFVKIANCSALNLTNIPASIPNDVELLDLSHNNILELTPRSLQQYSSLHVLMLRYNALTTLSTGTFSGNRKLRYLDLEGTVFNFLSADIFQHLNHLRAIVGLEAESLVPGIFQSLFSLQHLSLVLHGGNISDSLLLNVQLKSLELTILHARRIPEFFLSSTTSLQQIIINGPMLEKLDSSLLINHTMLQSITINVNGMEKLNDNFFSNLGQQVTLTHDDFRDVNQVLNLLKDQEKVAKSSSRNYLQQISIKGVTELEGKLFSKVPNVAYLLLEEVPHFPPDVFNYLQRLDTLQLSKNSLAVVQQEWFDGLSGLHHLNLSRNELRRVFANDFAGLNSLVTLDLSYNSIRTVKEECFNKFAHVLRYLDLSQNKLCTMPEGVFDRMSSLLALNISHNCMTGVPSGLFLSLESLQTLRLEFNRLTRIPLEALSSQTELQVLNVSYNSVTDISTDIFYKLPSLKYLDLRGNRLAAVSADVIPTPTLIRGVIVYDSLVNCSCEAFQDVFTVHGYDQLGDMFQGTCFSPHHLHGLEMEELTLATMCPGLTSSAPIMSSPLQTKTANLSTTISTQLPDVHSMLVEINFKKTSDLTTRTQSTHSIATLGSTVTHSAAPLTSKKRRSTHTASSPSTTAIDVMDNSYMDPTTTHDVSTNNIDSDTSTRRHSEFDYLTSDMTWWQSVSVTRAGQTSVSSMEASTLLEYVPKSMTELAEGGHTTDGNNVVVTDDIVTEKHVVDRHTTDRTLAAVLTDDLSSEELITTQVELPLTESLTTLMSTFAEDNRHRGHVEITEKISTEAASSSSIATTDYYAQEADRTPVSPTKHTEDSGTIQQVTPSSTSGSTIIALGVQSSSISSSVSGMANGKTVATSTVDSLITSSTSNQATGLVHVTSEQQVNSEAMASTITKDTEASEMTHQVQVTNLSTDDYIIYIDYYGSNSTDTYDSSNGSNNTTTLAARDFAAARQPELEKNTGDLDPALQQGDDINSGKQFYEEPWFYFLISFFAALFVVVLVIVAMLKSRGRLFQHSYSLERRDNNWARC